MHQDNYLYGAKNVYGCCSTIMSNPPSYIYPFGYPSTRDGYPFLGKGGRDQGNRRYGPNSEIFDEAENNTILVPTLKVSCILDHIQKPDKLRIYMLPAQYEILKLGSLILDDKMIQECIRRLERCSYSKNLSGEDTTNR